MKVLSEAKARRLCLRFRDKHDKRAARIYRKNSCGYCDTEDCSCNGFSQTCDCHMCEELYNVIEKTGMVNKKFKNILADYIRFAVSDIEIINWYYRTAFKY